MVPFQTNKETASKFLHFVKGMEFTRAGGEKDREMRLKFGDGGVVLHTCRGVKLNLYDAPVLWIKDHLIRTK